MKINKLMESMTNRMTTHQEIKSRFHIATVLWIKVFIVSLFVFLSGNVAANGNRIYIECPCTFERTEDGRIAITAAFHSFRNQDTQYLRFDVFALENRNDRSRTYIGNVLVDHDVPGLELVEDSETGETSEESQVSVSGKFYGDFLPSVASNQAFSEAQYLQIYLYRNWNRSGGYQDVILSKDSVNLLEPFSTTELDYLKDTDGDGVGDVNEEDQGTDPLDPDSVPEGATIDVLAMYSPAFDEFHSGDPYTRIQHIMNTTNSYVRNSGLTFEYRVVGMLPVDVDDYNDFSAIDIIEMADEGDRHGADMAVVFKGASDAFHFICGYTYLTGYGLRGYMPLRDDRIYTAYVITGCPTDTTGHELGHILGLGHAEWQNSIGSWRFARGHAVQNEFHTIMSYGWGSANKSTVFSNPDLDSCYGNDCGVHIHGELAAHSVLAMNTVQWQFENIRPSFPDSDGDGFVDPVDAVPDDATDWLDTDGDGIGDGSDPDDDGDGINDAFDAFPLDPDEFLDSDLDGVGNNGDAFPLDPDEQYDSDGDGVGDNADPFPFDPSESADTDGDGVGDNSDLFPEDPNEAYDTDGDGIGNTADTDDDNDGTEDAMDAYPLDATKTDLASWRLIGENTWDAAGGVISQLGDIDGDGSLEFMISAQLWDREEMENAGAVYIVSSADLHDLDALDGTSDRVIQLVNVPQGAHSWMLIGVGEDAVLGTSLATGDFDGDGVVELVLPSIGYTHTVDETEVQSGTVYIIHTSELSALDAADGSTDRVIALENFDAATLSMQIVGSHDDGVLGVGVSAGDVDGNGRDDLVVGASGVEDDSGLAYFIADSLLAPEGGETEPPHTTLNIDDALAEGNVIAISGDEEGDLMGNSVSLEGDFDADGVPELTVAARNFGTEDSGAIFILPVDRLDQADLADGSDDGKIATTSIQVTPGTWTITGHPRSDAGMRFVADGDIDGDGHSELIIRQEDLLWGYVVSGRDLQRSDDEDFTSDQLIELDNTRFQPNSWLVYGLATTRRCCETATAAVDIDGDGVQELLFGGDYWDSVGVGGAVHMTVEQMAESSLAQREILDDTTNRLAGYVIAWNQVLIEASTFSLILGSEMPDGNGLSVASVGDLDGDGGTEIAIGAPLSGHEETSPGYVHLIYSGELQALDGVDGNIDRFSRLHNVAGDFDGDGIPNTFDENDDLDTYSDRSDALPLISTEWLDTDGDGWGNNFDAFPADPGEWFDSDEDGTGNNEDEDDDADGINDDDDEYPRDTDNDGVMNRFDDDDDGDGVNDDEDADPYDPDVS